MHVSQHIVGFVRGEVSTQRVGRGRLRLWRDSAVPLQAWAAATAAAYRQCHPWLGTYWSWGCLLWGWLGFTLIQPICLVICLSRKPYCFLLNVLVPG